MKDRQMPRDRIQERERGGGVNNNNKVSLVLCYSIENLLNDHHKDKKCFLSQRFSAMDLVYFKLFVLWCSRE